MAGSKKGKRGRHHANRKRKHPPPPSPLSEDLRNSEYSKEVIFEYDRSLAPMSPVASSEDSDDSMGLSIASRAYWRSIERVGFGGSDDSEEVEDSSVSEEGSGGEGDGGSSDDGGVGDLFSNAMN
jgi:hypothetical protein